MSRTLPREVHAPHPFLTRSRSTRANSTRRAQPVPSRGRSIPGAARAVNGRLITLEGPIHRWLVLHSITLLRICLGAVFLGFGLLKYVPGASPAENLALTTTHMLTLGFVGDVVPYAVGLIGIATLEAVIGLSLITGTFLRVTVYLLIVQLIGIMSPLVLLPGRLFAGPFHAPTLEGQYVLKDVILVAAAMVVATGFRGARIRYPED